MNTMTLAICGERYDHGPNDSGYHIYRFAYLGEGIGHERPADANYALKLVKRLTDGEEETSWVEGHPTDGLVRLFDVIVNVENHGKTNARYAVDYRRYNGCPLEAVRDGMEIYSSIRKYGIRPAMKKVKQNEEIRQMELAERRNAAAARAEAEAKVPRFAEGSVYAYSENDSFGHVIRSLAKVCAVLNGRSTARVQTSTKFLTVRIREYDNGIGEYFTFGNAFVRAADKIVKEA